MRTTLDLPDDLFRQVKAKAALEGTKLKDLLTRYVESGLRQPTPAGDRRLGRSTPPLIRRKGKRAIPSLTGAVQAKLEEEEDIAKLQRSFGR
jgi:hypothetical protein